jgi:signal transduction histidine kinase
MAAEPLAEVPLEFRKLARALLLLGTLLVLGTFLAERFVSEHKTLVFLDNLHWTVAYASGAGLAWIGWRRSAPAERGMHAWFFAGLASYTLGQVVWDVQVAVGWNPFPGPSDALYILLGPCLGLGLAQALRRHVPRERLRSALLDISGLSIAVLALTLAFYLPRRGDVGWLPMVVYVAYPVFLLSASCIGILLVLAGRPRPAPGWIAFLVALFANGALWLRWNSLTLDGQLGDGTFLNLCFSLAALLQGFGALCWSVQPAARAAWSRGCDQALRLLPVLMPVIALAGAVLARELPDVPPVAVWCIAVGAGLVLLISLVRQSLLNSELEQRVRARTAELAATNRELETFAYSVSHDLKAPLRGIDGYSAMLEQDFALALPPEGQRYLGTIRRASQQMSRLIDDLLEYSRIERRVLQPALVEPRVLVEAWREERAAELASARAWLTNELSELRLQADRQGLEIVLRNLLDNALKFSSRADEPAISVRVRETRGSWIFSVRDNGIGFDMQYQERIFEIFQRLNREEDYPGTGVGLAMVRRSAERMGGRVWAESSPGAGATFHLEIPK